MPERKTKRPVGRRRVTRVSRGAVSAEDFGNDVLCARARARKFYYLHLLNATPVRAKVQKFLCFRVSDCKYANAAAHIKKSQRKYCTLLFGPLPRRPFGARARSTVRGPCSLAVSSLSMSLPPPQAFPSPRHHLTRSPCIARSPVPRAGDDLSPVSVGRDLCRA